MKMFNQVNIIDIDVSTSSPNSSYSMIDEFLVDDDLMFLGEEPPVTSAPVRLHIKYIPFRYKEHNLVQLFSCFGTVLDAEVIYNSRGSRGYGFVTMARREEAELILERLHNSVIDKRAIKINMATPKKSALNIRGGNGAVNPSNLLLAEVRLAQARLDVKRLREELAL